MYNLTLDEKGGKLTTTKADQTNENISDITTCRIMMQRWMDNSAGRRIARWFIYRMGTSNVTTGHWHMQVDSEH